MPCRLFCGDNYYFFLHVFYGRCLIERFSTRNYGCPQNLTLGSTGYVLAKRVLFI